MRFYVVTFLGSLTLTACTAILGDFTVSATDPEGGNGDGGADGGGGGPGAGGDVSSDVPPVTALGLAPLHMKIALKWTNPTSDFADIRVVRKAEGPPATPSDGTLVFQGKATSALDTNLEDGKLYHYAVFVTGARGNASAPARAEGAPVPSGSLDPTFNGGKAFVHGGLGMGATTGAAAAIDGAGNIVVAGTARGTANDDMAVWRLRPDGTLDATFGSEGLFTHDGAAASGATGHDSARGVAVDSKGRIYVTGDSFQAAGPPQIKQMALWALTNDGKLDTTFNAGKGFVVRRGNGSGGVDFGSAILVSANGRPVVTGQTFNTTTGYDTSIWSFNADGTPNAAFGGNGVLTDDMGLGSSHSTGIAIGLDPKSSTNKLYASGISGSIAMYVRRYSLDGFPDTSFGGDRDGQGGADGWTINAVTDRVYTAHGVGVDVQ
ncbi:MAG: hypothetical protein K0S65_3847, partial [Labilithrix sp.]|nr:hypothetical protein [Labilithrix sp.]